jgi:hypothetical protein
VRTWYAKFAINIALARLASDPRVMPPAEPAYPAKSALFADVYWDKAMERGHALLEGETP